MRILWVKVGGLWPLTAGGRLRSFHVIRELSRRHTVTLLTTHAAGEPPPALQASLPDVEVVSYRHDGPKHGTREFAWALARSWFSKLPVDLWRWRVPALRADASRRIYTNAADVCVADFLAAAPNIPFEGPVPVVLFEHNVEHIIWKRLALVERQPVRRGLLEIEWRKMKRLETRACAAARATVTVSDADRSVLSALAPHAACRVVPTGVDTSYFHATGARVQSAELVFTGSMDWYPNEDAILYFTERVLPLIRTTVPAATLCVVGRNPSSKLRATVERAGGRVTDTVPDIRPFIDRAAVYVVPLRVGGGTRLKVFEALAMGKAVVSTSIGAEGLPIEPGRHFLQADDPTQFAAAVIALLRNPLRRRELGTAGRELVEAHYSWTQVAGAFETACEEVAAYAH